MHRKGSSMKNLFPALVVLALLSLSARAREPLYGSVSSDFKVKATVDSFTGKAVSNPVVVQPEDPSINVTFEIAKMETGKKKRDKEMMHMFHADEFPLITGTAAAGSLLELKTGDEADLPVSVTLHGETRSVTGKVTAVTSSEGRLSFDMEFPLSLKAFGLKPPSVIGIIRVNDTVQVLSHVTLDTSAPAQE